MLFAFSADEDIDSKFPTNIVVYSDGTCSWVPLGLYISSCSINIQWFPFDDQFCHMKFGSWTYDGSKIDLKSKSDKMDVSTYQESGEWILIGQSQYRCSSKKMLENLSIAKKYDMYNFVLKYCSIRYPHCNS